MAKKTASRSPIPPASASIGFISLGCAKNLVDSEIMAAHLTRAGWRLAAEPEQAEIVIINTCAFIEESQKEALETILEVCQWKNNGICRAVLVAGCLPQRHQHELPAAMPEVDAWIGLDEVEQVATVIRRLADGERTLYAISPTARRVIEPPAARPIFTGAPYAYLKIAEGCSHHCRFCAIPRIRGRHRSRPLKSIIAEAEDLLASGMRELNIISQDVTAYGSDLTGSINLAQLLKALGRIGGQFWIRLLYGHPAFVSDELLATMGEVEQVCHYLDLPIQHSHPEMLHAMGRPPVRGGLTALFSRIRTALPDVTLRTTCLVGYPGETATHFQHLLDFVEETGFDHLGAFAYSAQDGTPAARLTGQVTRRTAQARQKRLMLVQQKLAFQRIKQRIGREDKILIENRVDSAQYDLPFKHGNPKVKWIGRSHAEAPEVDGVVLLEAGRRSLRLGDFVSVRYVAADGYDIGARLIPARYPETVKK